MSPFVIIFYVAVGVFLQFVAALFHRHRSLWSLFLFKYFFFFFYFRLTLTQVGRKGCRALVGILLRRVNWWLLASSLWSFIAIASFSFLNCLPFIPSWWFGVRAWLLIKSNANMYTDHWPIRPMASIIELAWCGLVLVGAVQWRLKLTSINFNQMGCSIFSYLSNLDGSTELQGVGVCIISVSFTLNPIKKLARIPWARRDESE